MEELQYYSAILDNAANEGEDLCGIFEEEMKDHVAMMKLGISTQLINDRIDVLMEIDGCKLQRCELLLRAYQIYEDFKKYTYTEFMSASRDHLFRTFTAFLVIGHLEDLLIYYREIAEEEAIC